MKTIFAVIAVENPMLVRAAIVLHYSNDSIALTGDQWLVADEGTSQSVFYRLAGLPMDSSAPSPIGGVLVLSVSSYWGSKPANVWEWLKAKWGSQSV